MAIRVLENTCVGCGECVPVCPTEALSVWTLASCEESLCTDCLECVPYCPVDALAE